MTEGVVRQNVRERTLHRPVPVVYRVTRDLLRQGARVFSIEFLYLCWLVKTSRMFALNMQGASARFVCDRARAALRLTNG